jgi:exonuclease III
MKIATFNINNIRKRLPNLLEGTSKNGDFRRIMRI